jgi:cyclopropane fatty-acyl-phospholipid synthase-like methyltransferase
VSPLARDRAAHHDWLVSLVTLPAGAVLIDLGCGRGTDLQRLAGSCQDESVRFIGIDNSDAAEDASARSR